MATKWVKYKLVEFGNGGYVTPDAIFEGGNIWENNSKVADMVLYGKADIVGGVLPEGVIAIVTEQQILDKQSDNKDTSLRDYKSRRYGLETDPLFIEALREKLEGRRGKWKAYVKQCKTIYNITEIPEDDI